MLREKSGQVKIITNDSVGYATYNLDLNEEDRLRLKKLCSPYVDGGFRKDILEINEVELYEDAGFIVFTMSDFHMPSDGEFHLSSLMADVCLLHAGVIYSHVDTGSTIKDREVYLKSGSIRYLKPISERKFRLDFYITEKRISGPLKHYTSMIDFNNGCFVGEYSWMVPLP